MNQSKITVRYAKALYLAGEEQKILPLLYEDIGKLYNTLLQTKDFTLFVNNPQITHAQKIKITEEIFKDKIKEPTLNFLLFIIRKKRAFYILNILRTFLDYYKSRQKIKSAVLTTTTELHDDFKQQIIDVIKQHNDFKVEMTHKVNKDLIGGFTLQINDQLYDASVSTNLNQIRQHFLDKKI
jgi:F-type H+-transporting ATPase subunit delta